MAIFELLVTVTPLLLLGTYTLRDGPSSNWKHVENYALQNPRSLSFHPIPPPPPCFDANRNKTECLQAKARGLCTTNPDRMSAECRKTCDLCTDSKSCIVLLFHGVPQRFCYHIRKLGPIRPVIPTNNGPSNPDHKCITLLFRGEPRKLCFPEVQPIISTSTPIQMKKVGKTCITVLLHGAPHKLCFDPPISGRVTPTSQDFAILEEEGCFYTRHQGVRYPICIQKPSTLSRTRILPQPGNLDNNKNQTCWTLLLLGAPLTTCISNDQIPEEETVKPELKPHCTTIYVIHDVPKEICFYPPSSEDSADKNTIKLDEDGCWYPMILGAVNKMCFDKKTIQPIHATRSGFVLNQVPSDKKHCVTIYLKNLVPKQICFD